MVKHSEDDELHTPLLPVLSNSPTSNLILPKMKQSNCPNESDQKLNSNDSAKRKLITASILCFFFFLMELSMGIYANSLAILSDSFHLLSDIAGFLISLTAIYLSSRPATARHSWGYHRAEILGAILSTFMIWFLTAYLVVEAFDRIYNPVEINAKVMFFTAFAGVLINVALGLTLHEHHGHSHSHDHHEGHNHSHSHNHNHEAHDHDHSQESNNHTEEGIQSKSAHSSHSSEAHLRQQTDTSTDCTSIFISDNAGKEKNYRKSHANINISAAAIHVIGDLISSIGVLISSIIIWYDPSKTIVDPLCTFIFSIFVLATTIKLVYNSLGVLMEGTPSDVDPDAVIQDLLKIEGVVGVHDLHIWTLTIGKVALAAHIDIGKTGMNAASSGIRKIEEMSIQDYNSILNQCQDLICSKYGIHNSTIQLENHEEKNQENVEMKLQTDGKNSNLIDIEIIDDIVESVNELAESINVVNGNNFNVGSLNKRHCNPHSYSIKGLGGRNAD